MRLKNFYKDIMVVCDWFYNCYVEPRPAQPMDAWLCLWMYRDIGKKK